MHICCGHVALSLYKEMSIMDEKTLVDLKNRIVGHKLFPHAMAVLRGILSYSFYALMCAIVIPAYNRKFDELLEGVFLRPVYPEIAFELILLLLMLNSVILTFAIYNRAERKRFLTGINDGIEDLDPKKERGRLLHTGVFWTELLTLFVLFVLFPMPWGFSDLTKVWPLLHNAPAILKNTVIFLIFAVSTFLITLHSCVDAKKMWIEIPGRLMQHKIWMSLEKKSKRKFSYFSMMIRLVGYLLIYGVIVPMYVMIPGFFASVFRLALTMSFEPVFIGIFIAIVLLFYFRTFHTRVKFIRRLKKTCKRNGFRLLKLHRPYRSIFRDGKGYNFAILANGIEYDCRVLASVKKSNKMILSDDGTCTRAMSVHIPTPALTQTRGYVQSVNRGNGDDREIMRMQSSVDYTFEADGKKVLIINPVPKRVIASVQGVEKDMDNGDKIGEYSVFTGNAFLRLLERLAKKDD